MQDIINKRKSIRCYINKPLENDIIGKINGLINIANNSSSLSFRLINDKNIFKSFFKTYGLFRNVPACIALIGQINDINLDEKVGYYGEDLVLELTKLNLGTCWVGSTYDKKLIDIKEDEKLCGVIALGYYNKQTKRKKINNLSKVYESDVIIGKWMKQRLENVYNAPTAVNRKEVKVIIKNQEVFINSTPNRGYEMIDLGIAKRHFEEGTTGKFLYGNNAIFNIKYEKSCGAVVYNKETDEVLLLLMNNGHTSIPKGHMEGNETEEETVKREIKEETNLNVIIDKEFEYEINYSPSTNAMKDVKFFAAYPKNFNLIAQKEEVQKCYWIKLDKAIDSITHISDKVLMGSFINYIRGKNNEK